MSFAVICDLDSLNRNIVPSHTEILHISEQVSTDIPKVLRVIKVRNLFPSLIYGATGKETDHTLHNLIIMDEYSKHNEIIFHDPAYKNKEKYGMFVSDYLCGNLKIGSKISMLSLCKI